LLVDNTKCELGVKKYSVKVCREISASSINGTKFVEKSEMIKRKYEEVIPATDSAQRQLEIGLQQINITDSYIELLKV
jgi:hypothetical protein